MLTEQNTPLPLVRQWATTIPHCWEDLDELADKTPCNDPLMAGMRNVCSYEHCTGTRSSKWCSAREIARIVRLFCCARTAAGRSCTPLMIRWPQSLYSRPTSGTIVIICRSRYCCIRRTAVLLSPVPALLTRRLSVSSRLSCEIWIKEHLSFTFCVGAQNTGTLTMPLYLNGLTVGDCINATTKAANRAKHPDGYEVNLDRTTILRYLNLYLYICAANADIASTPAQTYRPRSAAAPIRDRFREVQSYDTGLAIGSALRRAQAEEKNTKAQQRGTARRRSGHIRTHTRRGHWHHFWTGSKSKPESRKVVLRWLHPMLVGRSDEPDTTTVHPVQ